MGKIIKSKKNGVWESWYENGNKKDSGRYIDGKEVGDIVCYNSDGTIESRHTINMNGELNSHYFYFPSGKLSKEYKTDNNEQVQGIVKFYYENGTISEKTMYSNGKKEGIQYLYYENGHSEFIKSFKSDILHGGYQEFYKSGKEMVKGQYKGGKKIGKWIWVLEDGNIKTTENY